MAGYLIAVATKTHKITDLIVRSFAPLAHPAALDRRSMTGTVHTGMICGILAS